MQSILGNSFSLLITSTLVITIFAIGYLALIMVSSRRIIAEQKSKLEEIQKSEQRYKALFENSIAGMMKFNFTTWEVLEANEALREMFNCETTEELQKTFQEFPFEQYYDIETSLHSQGSIDTCEIQFTTAKDIKRRYLFSARREGETNLAEAVIVYVTSNRMLG